ncbi:hypothetical protein PoB_003666300 [Plakobranchus ocellatus]|uniref:Uncharacterized protein n=1 Tax=Plakobranchus ocellatus TaxID=259542 RepID=A0AAV4ATL8_9GAST|nr:hypothetical protein PoB_003666300 [Plakobranchus ocellatus]
MPVSSTLGYEADFVDKLEEMENLGIIKKHNASFASLVVVVRKKVGSNRVCRRLNKLTVFDLQLMVPPTDVNRPEDAIRDDKLWCNPDPRREDVSEKDEPCGELRRRSVGPPSNLKEPREDSE